MIYVIRSCAMNHPHSYGLGKMGDCRAICIVSLLCGMLFFPPLPETLMIIALRAPGDAFVKYLHIAIFQFHDGIVIYMRASRGLMESRVIVSR